MPVCSYLVYPSENCAQNVIESLSALEGCYAQKADNKELIILVTESENKEEEADLQEKIRQIQNIECLALSFGQMTEQEQEV